MHVRIYVYVCVHVWYVVRMSCNVGMGRRSGPDGDAADPGPGLPGLSGACLGVTFVAAGVLGFMCVAWGSPFRAHGGGPSGGVCVLRAWLGFWHWRVGRCLPARALSRPLACAPLASGAMATLLFFLMFLDLI